MLYFRRICLLVALALTFGASDLFAQGAPAGISVRIVQPADSAWVGIGGKIIVDVSSRPLLSGIRANSSTDSTFLGFPLEGNAPPAGAGIDEVLLYVDRTGGPHDKTVDGGATRTLTGYPGNTDPANDILLCRANYFHNSPVLSTNKKKVTWDGAATPHCTVTGEIRSFQGAAHVARYTFVIKGTLGTENGLNFRQGVSGIYAVVGARPNGGGQQAVANVEAGGDNKFVQIDTGRPVQADSQFDSVGVAWKADGATFKIGSKIEMKAKVLGIADDADVIEFGLFGHDANYAPGYNSLRDSALVKSLTSFKIDRTRGVIEGADANNVLRKTITVEENAFKILGDATADNMYDDANKTILMDNLRFKVAVFFVDRAGNIGANRADAVAALPFSSAAFTYTVDSKNPKITIRHPVAVDHPDSNRFTGLISKSFSYRENNGETTAAKAVDFNPLELKVDESLDSLIAIIVTPKDSLARADVLDDYTETGAFQKIPTTSFRTPSNKMLPSSTKGGQKVDLMIVARDEVGNRMTKTVKGVIHDEDLPQHTRAFPLAATAPQDANDAPIITNQTRHPVLRFNEALDSLSIRFVQNITSGPDTAIQQVTGGQLTMVNKDITVRVKDTLKVEGAEYTFQYYARDLAGNVHILPTQALTFKSGFANPTANKFIVTADRDSQIVGKNIVLTITAVDSAIRRADSSRGNAVTYRNDVRLTALDGDDTASTVVFANNSGSSVAKNADGTYNVAGSGWQAAVVKVAVKSNKVIDNFSVLVEEIETVEVGGENQTRVSFDGKLDSLYVDADRMEKFAVTAWEDGEEAKTVSGEFQVKVVPTDKFGNPSIKKVTGNAALDTRLTNANKFTNFSVRLEANHARAEVPGAQRMVLAGKTFTVEAPNGNGKGLTISATIVGVDPGETAKYLVATGSVTVDYSAVAPTAADSLAAPASLTVMDVPDDQGHFVRVTFPLSTDHDVVDSYRLYRELDLGDGSGPRFIQWGDAIEPSGADSLVTVHRAVPDALATHWAIEAIGDKPSSRTVSGKLSAAIVASARTQTEAPVGAIDNMPPQAATDVMLESATVSWTLSPSEGPTGQTWAHPLFAGSEARAIPGVTGYEIWVGLSADAMYSVGKVDAGESSFALTPAVIASLIAQGAITQAQLAELVANDLIGVMVRVDALDLSNNVESEIFVVEKLTRRAFTSADGAPVFIVALDGDMTVGFDDFMAFAAAFDTRDGDDNWNVQADLNDDGTVDFADFILFVGSYGKTAQGPSTKPVILPPGVNENAEFSLRLGSERVVVGQNVFVDVSLANVQDLMGYGFVLNYDADKFEFVEAAPADQDLLKSTGGETPLFSSLANEAGQVSIANAVVNASEISGGGDIVRLTFRVLQEFAENARFEIAEGLVFDPQQLSNPAVVAGVLNVQTTPTEFALLQNFPNPFNPETTIGYELAESADVTLQIYNVVGQVVRTLIAAEPQAAGRYQMRWDGMDDRGVSVSSGVYFYRISAGEFQTVRKLMLLK